MVQPAPGAQEEFVDIMYKPVRCLLGLVLVMFLAGCSVFGISQQGSAGDMDGKGLAQGEGVMLAAGTATQAVDGTQVTLTMAPWPPTTLSETSLTVRVQQDQQPVSGLKPLLDLTMPGMTMPENRPAAVEQDSGTYLAKTILTMGGRWQIDVELDLPGGAKTVSFLLDANE